MLVMTMLVRAMTPFFCGRRPTNLAKVVGRAAAAADERDDTIALQELLEVTLHRVDERLVRRDLQLAVQKRLRRTRQPTTYDTLIQLSVDHRAFSIAGPTI